MKTRRSINKLIYLAAFILVPLCVGLLMHLAYPPQFMSLHKAEPLPGPLPAPPPRLPHKPVVAVLVSNRGSEVSGLLAPYQILAASGRFNVYTVAPRRRVSPLSGGVDILPHYSFAQFERLFPRPALVVVPAIVDHHDPQILAWLNRTAAKASMVLAICEGARVLAASGLLDGHRATSHFYALSELKRKYRAVQWQEGVRYVKAGKLITSAGVTAALDASLAALSHLAGEEAARKVAAGLAYPWPPDPRAVPAGGFGPGQYALMALTQFYSWKKEVGVLLRPGADELSLAALLDTYSRVFDSYVWTMAAQRRVMVSRHGLHLVPVRLLRRGDPPEVLLVPDRAKEAPPSMPSAVALDFPLYQPGGRRFVFDLALEHLASRRSQAMARVVATMIEYPLAGRELPGRSWPWGLLLRPLLLGVLAVAAAARRPSRRSRRTFGFRKP